MNDNKSQSKQEELIQKKYQLEEKVGEANIRIKELERTLRQLNEEYTKK